jgi:hypothetical protein
MNGIKEVRALLNLRVVQLAALTAALTLLGWFTFGYKFCVLDPDLYWHIATGNWIVDHMAVPHTGILSRTAASLPWTAYSWGYEVLVSRAGAWFGLLGLGLFGAGMTFMVALTLFWSLLRLSGGFWSSLGLCVVACAAFVFSLMPRPVFFSMSLYILVLTLLLEARRRGNIRLLYWLPAIFLLWANLHIQFIYGLFPIGLMLGLDVLQKIAERLTVISRWMSTRVAPVTLSPMRVAIILGLTMAATCIGPYGFHLYGVVLGYSKATLTYKYILELQSIPFTYYEQHLIPPLAAGAFFALGRQKRTDLFKLTLLAFCVLVSFRTRRDIWFLCTTAAILIADSLSAVHEPAETAAAKTDAAKTSAKRLKLPEWAAVTAAVFVLLLLIAPNMDFTARGLNRAIAAVFPVDACNFIRRNPLPGPMYNSFDWGGFLTWYLPMYPVSGDGRNDLYSDKLDQTLLLTEREQDSYKSNPYLNEAGFLLLWARTKLGKEVAVDPRFRRVYNDGLAAIYVRNDP